MSSRNAISLLRAACLVALTFSAMLMVDYTNADPSFCASGSGCDEVRTSGFGYLFGVVPVPVLGLVAFGLLFLLSLAPWQPLVQRSLGQAALFGAAAGVALIVAQVAFIGALCSLCAVVDGAAIVAGVAGAMLLRAPAEPAPEEFLPWWTWLAIAVVLVGAPALYPRFRPAAAVPESIAVYYEDGKINVVEFADFECPFCRDLHPRLVHLMEAYGDEVNFVRLNKPLPMHRNARDAARAYVCADDQGHAEEMADRLFALEELSVAANRGLAEQLGLDMAAYDACLGAATTEERIDTESAAADAAGFRGLPTTYVGPHKILGAQRDAMFEAALADTAAGGDGGGMAPESYVAVDAALLIGLVVVGIFLRRREREDEQREDEQRREPDEQKG